MKANSQTRHAELRRSHAGASRSKCVGIPLLWLTLGCSGEISSIGGGEGPPGGETTGGGASAGGSTGWGTGGAGNIPIGECTPPAVRVRKLTASQYDSTVRALLPNAERTSTIFASTIEPVSEGFSTFAARLEMSEPHVAQLFEAAESLAEHALSQDAELLPCMATGLTQECVSAFVQDFGSRAFRRTLEGEETQRYADFWAEQAATHGSADALHQVITAIFMSPHFLYRTELGSPGQTSPEVSLTAHERASLISYALADGPPDAELFEAASAGQLGDADSLRPHIARLLTSAERSRGVVRFFDEYLDVDQLASVDKDIMLFPQFDQALTSDMAEETRLFVQDVLWEGDSRLATLLTADYTFANARLAGLYGVDSGSGAGFERVALPNEERAGFLSHVGLMAQLADRTESTIPARGLFVMERLLCREVPPPPPTVNAAPPPPDPNLTRRERLAVHSADPTCAACHEELDNLGFAFEHYDAIGIHRSLDSGQPVDASGHLITETGTVAFRGAVELATELAKMNEPAQCLGQHLQHYLAGTNRGGEGECRSRAIGASFAQTDGDVLKLVTEAIIADALLVRRREFP